jgi:hypothetical protein
LTTLLILLALLIVAAFVIGRLLRQRTRGPAPYQPPAAPEPESDDPIADMLAREEAERQATRAAVYASHNQVVSSDFIVYTTKKIMNKPEGVMYQTALRAIRDAGVDYYAFPEVALGAALNPKTIFGTQGEETSDAYRAISGKRCDLIIADSRYIPIIALEWQGSGHYMGQRFDTTQRDAIKRTALRKAGVQVLEFADGTQPDEIERRIRDALAETRVVDLAAQRASN